MRRATVVLALALVACDQEYSNVVAIEIVGPTSLDPVGDAPGGDLSIRIEQTEFDPIERLREDIGSLSALEPVEIGALNADTRILVSYTPDEGPLQIGATPPFIPFLAGVARVIVGPAGECHTLARTQLPTPRYEPAVWPLFGTRWIVFGGATETTGHGEPAQFTPVWLTIDRETARISEGQTATGITTFPEPFRESQLIELFPGRALVLASTPAGGQLWRVDPSPTSAEIDRANVGMMAGHFGLGEGSTLVDLGEGAVVVGGGDELSPSDSITWLREDGDFNRSSRLAHARFRPAVAFMSGRLVVVGGQRDGEPLVEVVPEGMDGIEVASPTASRMRPALAVPPASFVSARGAAMIVGGADVAGEPVATTLLLSGCPDACAVAEAPALLWENPRLRPTVVRAGAETLLLGGEDRDGNASDRVDRISFITTTDITFAQDRQLDEPRARGTAVEVTDGIVLLLGGRRGTGDHLSTFEMCWPASLPSLD